MKHGDPKTAHPRMLFSCLTSAAQVLSSSLWESACLKYRVSVSRQVGDGDRRLAQSRTEKRNVTNTRGAE